MISMFGRVEGVAGQFIVNAPTVAPGNDLYWIGFWELSSCRAFKLGPIPWDKVHLWARARRLSADQESVLYQVVCALDPIFLDRWSKAIARANKNASNR